MSQFNPAQSSKRWMLVVASIAVLLWLGLWGLLQLPVTGSTRAFFFVLLFCAITSTAMPPIAYLNARFGRCRHPRTFQARFVRQSIWLGLLTVVLGWLQMRRLKSSSYLYCLLLLQSVP